ncbi:MAG: hypothetical protein IJY47_04005 [Clostridia bacterium]|nr:hypothetical protein [Clostridia bacterium]
MKKTLTSKQTGSCLAGRKEVRVRLAIALSLLLLAILLPMIISIGLTWMIFGSGEQLPPELAGREDPVFLGVWLVLGIFLTLPAVSLFYSYTRYCYLQAKDACGYGGIFRAGGYGKHWIFGFFICLRPLGCAVIVLGTVFVSEQTRYFLHLPLLLAAIALCALWMWGSGGWFLLPYEMCRGSSILAALRKSRRVMKGRKALYGRYVLSFLGDGLLSLVTVGVWLVFNALPKLNFTYFALAEELDGEGTQKETIS